MPRLRKTESQRRAERFRELYKDGKKSIGATEEQIGAILGVSRPTLKRKRDNPENFSLGEFITFCARFSWSDEEILSIVRPERKNGLNNISDILAELEHLTESLKAMEERGDSPSRARQKHTTRLADVSKTDLLRATCAGQSLQRTSEEEGHRLGTSRICTAFRVKKSPSIHRLDKVLNYAYYNIFCFIWSFNANFSLI